MITATYHLEPSPSLPFHVLGNRYATDPPRETGSTLIFLHATSLHKETWEPHIAHLFALSEPKQGSSHTLIREAWSIDYPNHGESAVLNEDILKSKYADHWDADIFPKSVHAFLLSRPGGIDLAHHTLIGVGHSIGGNVLMIVQALAPRIHFKALVLLDATISRRSPARDRIDRLLTPLAWAKTDTWTGREEARKSLARSPGYRGWNPAVLDKFVEKALRTHPAARYPDPYAFSGVTLACSRSLEAASYRAFDNHDAAFDALQDAYNHGPPVHCIQPRRDEFGDEVAKLKTQVFGQGPTSLRYLEKGGHLFVQTQPEASAAAVWEVIQSVEAGPVAARL